MVFGALFGGAGRVGLELALELQQQGIETDIFLALGSGELVPEARQRGLVVFSSREGENASAPRAVWQFARALVRLIWLARRYDVLLGANDAVDHLLCLLAGRLLGKPVAGEFQLTPSKHLEGLHGVKRTLMGFAMRQATPRLDLLIANSQGVLDDAVSFGITPAHSLVIPNAIPIARIWELAQAYEVAASSEPVVLGVGRLAPEKGFDILLRAHALARPQAAHRLRLLGDGPERELLERLISDLGVESSVDLAGSVANPYPELLAADLVCVPSRHEGYSLVAREALLFARPLLVSDCPGGLREAVHNGRYGQLVPTEDPEALAAALVDYLRAPQGLQAKAQEAVAVIEDECDLPLMAERYAAALSQLGHSS
jgi:glycosyltransferase involved in cell wall biosynthesis